MHRTGEEAFLEHAMLVGRVSADLDKGVPPHTAYLNLGPVEGIAPDFDATVTARMSRLRAVTSAVRAQREADYYGDEIPSSPEGLV